MIYSLFLIKKLTISECFLRTLLIFKVPDNDKLLKRQARFGVISNSNTEVDEKKQKRAERFGTTSTAVGSSDEQKRKRAERFGLA